MAAVQFYPDTTVFSVPSSSTFNSGPNSDIIGGRFGVSNFHDLSGLPVVLFPAHRSPMNRMLKRQPVLLAFFVLSYLHHALPSFSHGWTDLVDLDLPSEVPRSQSVGLPWTSDQPVTENCT